MVYFSVVVSYRINIFLNNTCQNDTTNYKFGNIKTKFTRFGSKNLFFTFHTAKLAKYSIPCPNLQLKK